MRFGRLIACAAGVYASCTGYVDAFSPKCAVSAMKKSSTRKTCGALLGHQALRMGGVESPLDVLARVESMMTHQKSDPITTSFEHQHSRSGSSASESGLAETSRIVTPSLTAQALQHIETLYPQAQESERIAAARKDGYWPYISKKQEPPPDFTYGEFPLPFFGELIDHAVVNYVAPDGDDGERAELEFLDLGSGAGRLVLAAAAMSKPWKRVRGVEFLTSLSSMAQDKLENGQEIPNFLTSEVLLENCSWDAPHLDLTTVDVAFACGLMLRMIQLRDVLLASSLDTPFLRSTPAAFRNV